MSSPVVAEFEYLPEDAVNSAHELHRSIPAVRYVQLFPFILGVAALLIGLVAAVKPSLHIDRGLPLTSGVLFIAVGFASRWMQARRIRAGYAKSPLAGKRIRWTFDATEIQIETELSKSSFAWKALLDIRETESGFLLFPQPRYAHWVPRRSFGSDGNVAAFRELVRGTGLKFVEAKPAAV